MDVEYIYSYENFKDFKPFMEMGYKFTLLKGVLNLFKLTKRVSTEELKPELKLAIDEINKISKKMRTWVITIHINCYRGGKKDEVIDYYYENSREAEWISPKAIPDADSYKIKIKLDSY